MTPRLGFLAALADEAKTLTHHPRIDWHAIPALIEQSGIGAALARAATQRLLQQPLDGLISWGTAGSLDPRCAPGTIMIYETVRTADGEEYRCDPDWTRNVALSLRHEGVLLGAGYCAERALTGAAEKATVRARTACVAVDMESAALGELATAAGVPFIVVRVIVDAVDFDIPSCAATSVDSNGNPRIWRILRGLAKKPSDVLPLLRLARCYALALRRLRDVAHILQPHFAHPLLINNRV